MFFRIELPESGSVHCCSVNAQEFYDKMRVIVAKLLFLCIKCYKHFHFFYDLNILNLQMVCLKYIFFVHYRFSVPLKGKSNLPSVKFNSKAINFEVLKLNNFRTMINFMFYLSPNSCSSGM